jgi:hypothetical protein
MPARQLAGFQPAGFRLAGLAPGSAAGASGPVAGASGPGGAAPASRSAGPAASVAEVPWAGRPAVPAADLGVRMAVIPMMD